MPLPPLFRILIPLIVLINPLSLPAGDGRPDHTVSFHIEGREQDGPNRVFVETILGIEYFFNRIPDITHEHFASYYPFEARDGTTLGAAFFLNEKGRNNLVQLSTVNLNTYLVTVVDSRAVHYVKIDRPINDGIIIVWRGLTPEIIEWFDKKLKLTRITDSTDLPPLPPQGLGR